MKNLRYFSFTLLFISVGHFCHAQFEGQVNYAVTYSSKKVDIQSIMTSLPARSILLLKNSMVRFTQSIVGGGEQAFVSDTQEGTSILVMNFLGQPFQVKMDKEDVLQLQQTKKLEITEGTKTKRIAGRECRQAFALSGKDTLEIYYSPEIKTPNILPQFENLKGLPLEYEMNKGDLHIRYTCTAIMEEPVADSNFEVPSTVREIPFAQFAKSFAITK